MYEIEYTLEDEDREMRFHYDVRFNVKRPYAASLHEEAFKGEIQVKLITPQMVEFKVQDKWLHTCTWNDGEEQMLARELRVRLTNHHVRDDFEKQAWAEYERCLDPANIG